MGVITNNKQITLILKIKSTVDPVFNIILPDQSSDPLIDRIIFHEISENCYQGFHTFDNIGIHHLINKELGIDHVIEISENCGVTELDLCFLED